MIGSLYSFHNPNSPMRYWIVLPSSTVAVSVVCRTTVSVSAVKVMTGAVTSGTSTVKLNAPSSKFSL